jgi:hypothetical protein
MIYFMVLSAVVAILGLFLAAASVQTALSMFGFALFLFGTLFAFFLVKSHFDQKDAGGTH